MHLQHLRDISTVGLGLKLQDMKTEAMWLARFVKVTSWSALRNILISQSLLRKMADTLALLAWEACCLHVFQRKQRQSVLRTTAVGPATKFRLRITIS